MPVHRTVNSDRGAVTAFVSEIEAWRSAQMGSVATSTRQGLYWGALGVLACLVLVFSLAFFLGPGPAPAMVSFAGETLRVFNENRDLLWERVVPGFYWQSIGDGHPELPMTSADWLLITNLDADPENEVVISKRTRESEGSSDPLIAFDNDGGLLWETSLNHHLEAQGRQFDLFNAKPIRMFNGYLVATGEQEPYYPCQLVLINPQNGEIVDRYFHPGYLRSFCAGDVDGDGGEELLFAGCNNPGDGLGRPVMGALKVPFRKAIPKENDFFQNRVQVEKYLVFQSNDWNQVHGVRSEAVLAAWVPDGSFALRLVDANSSHIILDHELQSGSFRPSDAFLVAHKRAELEGLLDHEVDDEELTRISRILHLDYAPDCNSRELDELFEANAIPTYRVSDDHSATEVAD